MLSDGTDDLEVVVVGAGAVAVGPARAHSGRLGIMKTGEFSNAIFGEN